MNSITVAYASRFGSTRRLAEELAAGLAKAGAAPELLDVRVNPKLTGQPLVILTPIIWDRPLPAIREWIAANSALARQCTVACGVVCGAAGVRETGGTIYARQLAARIGRPDVFQFTLSGEIPARYRLRFWEWWALRTFATVMRKPQLFAVRANARKASIVGSQIGAHFLLRPPG